MPSLRTRRLWAVLASLLLLAAVACGDGETTTTSKKVADGAGTAAQDAGGVEDTATPEDTAGAVAGPVDAAPDVGSAGSAPCKALKPDFDCCCYGSSMTQPVCLNGKWGCAEPTFFKEYKGLACQGFRPGACGG